MASLTELKSRQDKGELTEAELQDVLETKRQSEAAKKRLGSLLTGRKHSNRKARPRRKPDPAKPEYSGLTGSWAQYYDVASRYEGKIPIQDRDDWRHDTMLELERAESRDGEPLPELRAYRIAGLMVALYYRNQNRYQARVCIVNGYPQKPHCKTCKAHTGSKRCAWLAVRQVSYLDDEIIDPDGYSVKLIDTVASGDVHDMPERWYDLKQMSEALPVRLVEIAGKKLDGMPLSAADRMYLMRYRQAEKKSLF